MSQICRKCSKKGPSMKDYIEAACRICRVAGHVSKDCAKMTTCNPSIQGGTGPTHLWQPRVRQSPHRLQPQWPRRRSCSESVRQNPEVRGITAPDRRMVNCSLYMDDVTVFCADRCSVTALVQNYKEFGRASGAKVNCGKSEAMLFEEQALTSFSIQSDFINIWEVWFRKEGAALKSWQDRMAKVNQKIGLWGPRQLAIEGKTLLLWNEVLPVLQHMEQAWLPHITVQ
ncbi:uncharacterized protein LOC122924707 [Bufo gargarizans]|uniref:uncharacterized protein LOC122924707 n=1 Tax=Bufo gargarizans TaxID=30331 RepID=UPI001CF18EFD|nr:uncharacterized protein LOC122924707 [Bufo gargarizans]